jgi:hypothetical protein
MLGANKKMTTLKAKATVILIFVSIIMVLSGCNQERTATLDIKIENQNKFRTDDPNISVLKILKNGKAFKLYKADSLPFLQQQITLKNVPYGHYNFQYLNILEQEVSKTVEVEANQVYPVTIYPDSTNYQKNISKTFILALHDSDTLEISNHQSGCFSDKWDRFSIIRNGKDYLLIRNSKTLELTSYHINYLAKLESDLMDISKEYSCTTSEVYEFELKGQSREYIDRSCRLHGWTTLIRCFFFQ